LRIILEFDTKLIGKLIGIEKNCHRGTARMLGKGATLYSALMQIRTTAL
jgi:hypothetical protein